jgi:hypothetical protein
MPVKVLLAAAAVCVSCGGSSTNPPHPARADAGSDAGAEAGGPDAGDPDSGSAECVTVPVAEVAECGPPPRWLFDGTSCIEGCSDDRATFASLGDCAEECAGAAECDESKVEGNVYGALEVGQEFDGVEVCAQCEEPGGTAAAIEQISSRFHCSSLNWRKCSRSTCGITGHIVIDAELERALCAISLLPCVGTLHLVTLE